MDNKKYPHSDHRQRVRAQFRKSGCENMPDLAILELLLFYAIPRRDTKPAAALLIEKYGSLRGVAEAPIEELEKIEGLGESSALLLSTLREISKRIEGKKEAPSAPLNHDEITGKILGDLRARLRPTSAQYSNTLFRRTRTPLS